jgi:hypothetical protein
MVIRKIIYNVDNIKHKLDNSVNKIEIVYQEFVI